MTSGPSSSRFDSSEIVHRALRTAEVEVKKQIEERLERELENRRLIAEVRSTLGLLREAEKGKEEAMTKMAEREGQLAALVERLNAVRGLNESLTKQLARERQENEGLRQRMALLEMKAADQRATSEQDKAALEAELGTLRKTIMQSSVNVSGASDPAMLSNATAFSRALEHGQRSRRVSVDEGCLLEEDEMVSVALDVSVDVLAVDERKPSPSPSPLPLSSSPKHRSRPWRSPGPASTSFLSSPVSVTSPSTRDRGRERRRCSTCERAPSLSPSPVPTPLPLLASPKKAGSSEAQAKAKIALLETQLEAACRLAVMNATEAIRKEKRQSRVPPSPPPKSPTPPTAPKQPVPQILLVALPSRAPTAALDVAAAHRLEEEQGRQKKKERAEMAAAARAQAALEVLEKAAKLRQALSALRGGRRREDGGLEEHATAPQSQTFAAAVEPASIEQQPASLTSAEPARPSLPASTQGWQPRPLAQQSTI